MTEPIEILRAHGIGLSNAAAGRHYTTCPRCSSSRGIAHKKAKVLGITIAAGNSVHFGCNHCGWTGPEKGSGQAEPLTTYDYLDEAGDLLFQKVRGQNKKFWQRRPDGGGGWINGLGETRRVIYRLPEITEALAAGNYVVAVEGEKDADNLWRRGVPATCNPDGAAQPGQRPKWRSEYSEQLRGADLVIIGDNDEPGRAHVEATAKACAGVASRVRVLDLAAHWPECPKGGDISDWFAAGHTREQFDALVGRAVDYAAEPIAAKSADPVNSQDEYGFSDDALALTFAAKHADELRYVAKWGKWMRYAGGVWREDAILKVFDSVRRICRSAADLAEKETTATRLRSASTVNAVEKLARSDPRLAATVDQWDADPWLLNTPGGAVDLRTGVLRPHRREDYCTKMTAVTPAGDCPLWLDALDVITANDDELVAFLQRMFGYSLTGSIKEHALFFLYGEGGNGKSLVLGTVSSILADYHTTAAMETFVATKHQQHSTDLASLQGARLVTAIETEQGTRWAESKVKQITGGDPIKARFMRQDFFEFHPVLKLVIAGNHKPGLRNVDAAMRRRFNLVPFTVTIPDDKKDKNLPEKLKAEWPGILWWMIDGCVAWQREGLKQPAAVTEATEEYLTAEDDVAAWIADCCDTGRAYTGGSTALYKSWQAWAGDRGLFVGSMKDWRAKLEKHLPDLRPKHTKIGNTLIGIALKPPPDPPPQTEPQTGAYYDYRDGPF